MVIKQLLVLMNEFWIAGCTYHMCPHKKWFFKFEEFDGGVVYMGSGDVSYITGIVISG